MQVAVPWPDKIEEIERKENSVTVVTEANSNNVFLSALFFLSTDIELIMVLFNTVDRQEKKKIRNKMPKSTFQKRKSVFNRCQVRQILPRVSQVQQQYGKYRSDFYM